MGLFRLTTSTLVLAALACTRPNPAFDESDAGGSDTFAGDGDGDTSVGDGDGDGKPDTGDGDGEPDTGDGDGDGEPDTGDGDGDGDACDGEQVSCDGMCVDLDTDPNNCGDCGVPCDEGQLCGLGECVPAKYVFVTAARFPGDINGLATANGFCANIASLSGLPGTYKAWLSDSVEWPDDTFDEGPGVYVRTDGEIVAWSYADLADGSLVHPIDRDQSGQPISPSPACNGAVEYAVWTGTDPVGKAAEATCMNWTANNDGPEGLVGDATATDASWTANDCLAPCESMLPFYCMAQ
jgi:hypothetical protein